MTKALSHRQATFVQEYVKTGNGKVAARKAGYSGKSARQTATRVLTYPRIQVELTRLQDDLAEKCQIERETLVRMFLNAYHRAESAHDMIVAARELGRLCGLYPDQRRS